VTRTRDDADRPQIAIVASFGLAIAGAVVFAVGYALDWSTQVLGAALAIAFGGLAVGLTVWARRLTQEGGYVEEHEGFGSAPAQTEALTTQLTEIARPDRRGLIGMLAAAVAALGAAAVFPLRSLLQPRGEHPVQQLAQTAWRLGDFRLVDAQNRPVHINDVTAETVLTVFPQGHTQGGDVPAFVVRIEPSRFEVPPPGGMVSGVVAYSLICTHAGCPVSLYEQTTAQMLCPCHQSVFDLLSAGRPVQGPAARSLPGLPIAVDELGFLYATGDFTSPPGPGYWSLP
jgi:ubiquinol-cytochrome c reductase iron-sulfur subunit